MTPGSFNTPLACVCGRQNGDVVATAERHGFPLTTKLCECGLVRSDPYYSDSEIDEYYKDQYRQLYNRPPEEQWELEVGRGERLDSWLASRIEWSEVFDIGCGAGGIAYHFDGIGCDIGPYVDYGRSQGVEIFKQSQIPGTADLLIASHLIEHFRNPIKELERILTMASRYVVLIVPFLSQIVTSYKCNFIAYLEDAHAFAYTPDSLAFVASHAGLKYLDHTPAGVMLFEVGGEPLRPPMNEAEVGRLLRSSFTVWQYLKEFEEYDA